jgi:hypothetical protein
VAIDLSWRFGCPSPTRRVGGQGIATKATDSSFRAKGSGGINVGVIKAMKLQVPNWQGRPTI